MVRWVDDGSPLIEAEAAEWMGVTAANYASRGYGMFAIDDRASLETIGFGGLVHPGGQPAPELKYAFHRKVWGRGFATEFVRGLLDHGWAALGLARVIATVAPENAASIRVLVKSGFKRSEDRMGVDGRVIAVFAMSPA